MYILHKIVHLSTVIKNKRVWTGPQAQDTTFMPRPADTNTAPPSVKQEQMWPGLVSPAITTNTTDWGALNNRHFLNFNPKQ